MRKKRVSLPLPHSSSKRRVQIGKTSVPAYTTTHLAGADLVLGLLKPGDPFVPKDVNKRVDFADDNLPAADQARVKVGRLVDPLVVVFDQLLVLDRVLREDLVPCRNRKQAGSAAES